VGQRARLRVATGAAKYAARLAVHTRDGQRLTLHLLAHVSFPDPGKPLIKPVKTCAEILGLPRLFLTTPVEFI
jgi:hypothetical protein